jgi:hypothetical protein
VDTLVDIDELAKLAGIDIPWGYHAGVATQFAALMVQAELVLNFPLDAEIEPAPVFTP